MSETLATEITTLQADVAALTTAVQTASTTIGTFATELAAALQAAQNAGATPAQLQALTDLHTTIAADTQALTDAVSQHPVPPPAA